MALSMQEKQHVGKEVALRYVRARKKEKGVMLQEFCATTGYSPPYAAFLLRTYAKRVILGQVTLVPTRPSPWPRQRKHLYGLAVVEGLIWDVPPCRRALWQAAGGSHAGTPACHGKTRNRGPGSSLCLPSEDGLCHHGPAAAPGQVEVDLVSHDGGKAAGNHCYTLTVTDRCSGWTEIVPVSNRAQVFVFEALTAVLTHLPFPGLVLHSDNGSEFINDELRRFCDAHGIRFTPEPFCLRRGVLSFPIPGTRTTTVTWRARTGPWCADAWDTADSIPRASLLTFSSWRPSLLSVPTSSSLPWPSWRRCELAARSRRGTVLLSLLCTGSCRHPRSLIRQSHVSCVNWGTSILSPCSGTSGSCRHGSSGRPARISPSRP